MPSPVQPAQPVPPAPPSVDAMPMIIFCQAVAADEAQPAPSALNRIALPFDARQRSRLRVIVTDGPAIGQAVGIDLPRGSMMRGGTVLTDAAGHWLRVDAAPEALLQVQSDSSRELARLAYHLGNRHVAVQVGDGWLRLQQDHVLEQMLQGLGAAPTRIDDCFEPEGGAYGHATGSSGHGHSHAHSHDHPHDHSRPAANALAQRVLHDHDRPGSDQGHPTDASIGHSRDGALPDRRHAPRIHDLAAPAPDEPR